MNHWLDVESARTWGYVCSRDVLELTNQVRALYFNGAARVLIDSTDGVEPRERPAFAFLLQPLHLRNGDTLLIASDDVFGHDPEKAGLLERELEAGGIAVWRVAVNEDISPMGPR
ncbi:MAG: hypothetical protein AAFX07_03960 [Pseudomonadota bacterium]